MLGICAFFYHEKRHVIVFLDKAETYRKQQQKSKAKEEEFDFDVLF